MSSYGPHNPYYVGNLHLPLNRPVVVRLYQSASTVRAKTAGDQTADNVLNLLQEYVNAVIVQSERIRDSWEKSVQLQLQQIGQWHSGNQRDEIRYVSDEMFFNNEVRIKDIHYFLIAVDKIQKLWSALLKTLFVVRGGHEDPKEIRLLRNRAEAALRAGIRSLGLDDARNYLEHIDKEILQGHHVGLESSTDFTNQRFKISGSGEEILLDAGPVAEAYEKLIDLIRQIPDR